MSTSTETIEQLATREYKYGFVTDVEADTFPPGLNEDVVRRSRRKKQEPEWLLEFRLKAYRAWLDDDGADVAQREHPADRLPGHQLLLGAEEEAGAEQPGRGRSRGAQDVREARHSARRADAARRASPSTPCSTACRWRRRSATSSPSSASSSARSREAVHDHPELVRKYLGSVVPYTDNFFATLNSAVFSDGSFAYIPKGVRCPMELCTYFRINAREHGPVRAHADHRRGRRVRELSRRLHGADARREPAARGRGRAGGARRRDHQVLDRPELVPGRQGRQGRHLQLRHQARRLPRASGRRSPGRRSRPARRSRGSIRAACSSATTRSASSTRWPRRTTASRPTPAPR